MTTTAAYHTAPLGRAGATTSASATTTTSTTPTSSIPLRPRRPGAPSPQPQPEEYVIALHSYTPPQGMTTCIAFHAGDVILVHSKDPGGWWDGSLAGQRGWFPSNYVSGDLGAAGAAGAGSSKPDTPTSSSSTPSSSSTTPRTPTQPSPTRAPRSPHTHARPRIPHAFTDAPHPHPPPRSHPAASASASASASPHGSPTKSTSATRVSPGTLSPPLSAAAFFSPNHGHAHSPQSSISTAATSTLSHARSGTSVTSATSASSGHSRALLTAQHTRSNTSLPPTTAATAALSPGSKPGTLDAVHKSVLLLSRAAHARRRSHYGGAAACVVSSVRTVLTAAECLSRSSGQLERWPELREARKDVLGCLGGIVKRAKALGGQPERAEGAGREKEGHELQEGGAGKGPEKGQEGAHEERKAEVEMETGMGMELDSEAETRELEHMLLLAEEVLVRIRHLVDVALRCGIDVPGATLSSDGAGGLPGASGGSSVGTAGGVLASPQLDELESMRTPTPASAPLNANANANAQPALPRVVETDAEGDRAQHRPPPKPRVQAAIAAHRARSLADLRAKHAREEPPPPPTPVAGGVLGKSQGRPAEEAGRNGNGTGTGTGRERGGSESSTSAGHSGSSQSGSMASLSSVASAASDRDAGAALGSSVNGGPIVRTPGELTQLLKHTQDASVSLFAALIGHVQTHSSGGHAASHARLVEVAAGAVGKLREAMWVVDAVVNHLAGKGRDKGVERLINARRGLWRLAGEVVDAAAGLTRGPAPGLAGEPASAEEEKKERLTKRGFEALRAVGDCVVAVKMGLAGIGPAESIKLDELASVEAFIRGGVVSALPGGNSGPTASLGPGGRPGTASGRGKETLDALAIKAARLLSLREEYLEEEEEEEEEEDDDEEEQDEHGHTPVPDVNQDTLRPKQLAKDVASTAPSSEVADAQSGTSESGHSTTSQATLTHSHSQSQSLSFSARPPAPLRILTGFGIAPSDGPVSPESGRLSEDGLNDLNIPLRSPTAFADPSRQQLQLQLPMPSFTALMDEKFDIGDLTYKPQTKLSGEASDWLTTDPDDPADVILNPDETVIGGTLPALVKRMTSHVATTELSFSASFFMTFRLFSTPLDLVDCLVQRWDVKLPVAPGGRAMTKIEHQVWHDRMLIPIRLRILNFVKTWLESHWRAETDGPALAPLQFFVDQAPDGMLKAASRKINDLIATRRLRPESIYNKYAAATISQANAPRGLDRTKSFDRMRSVTPLPGGNGAASYMSANPPPAPIVSRSLYSSLRAIPPPPINVTDFDPMELARQLSIMENKLYMSIQAQELLDLGKSGAPPAVSIKAITSLSTAITGLITDSVLREQQELKKRANLLKYYIKVAERSFELKNFSLLFSILAALTSSTVLRLSKTWAGVSSKYRTKLDELRKVTDYTRNYSEYRSRLRETEPAAVPFLGVYLTDITFCNGGNPSHRPSPVRSDVQLINFNKYRKLARIVSDMQRFQKAYNLLEISEAQRFLQSVLQESRTSEDHKDLYRRSLLIEPRETAGEPASADSVRTRTDIFGWAARSLGQTNPANPVVA
ncbi:ras GEF [Calocera cornea HHB12733]|uniref:Ras GEF n=1 Tax=Calocera cornea HHB12733 TaxID=1353952 RepID=A0A165I9F4_9BASI|nr:ras GEF [Calocera cornea HHB12733]